MAILQKIRDKTIVTLLVIGLGMVGFLFFGSDSDIVGMISGEDESRFIGEIYGEGVEYNSFNETYNIVKSNLKQQGSTDDEQILDQAWQSFINEQIVKSKCEELGIIVTDDEVYELQTGKNVSSQITGIPFFQNDTTKQFDPQLVKDYLQSLENDETGDATKQWAGIEEGLRKERLSKKYQVLIEQGFYATKQEAMNSFNENSQNARVNYISIPYSSVDDTEVEPSKEELKKFYNNHINEFVVAEETRAVEFIEFTVIPSSQDDEQTKLDLLSISDDFAKSEDDEKFVNRHSRNLNALFSFVKLSDITDPNFTQLVNTEKGTVSEVYKTENGDYRLAKLSDVQLRADSVEARHILLSNEQFTADSAKTLIKSLKQRVDKGEDFGSLALQFSFDKGSAIKGGDLGWFKEGSMVPAFNEACFTSEVNDMQIVTTNFGVHLIQLTGASKLQNKYKVVYIDKKVVASSETKDEYYNQASQFLSDLSSTSFNDLVTKENLVKRDAANIKEMTFNVSTLKNSREIVKWMFTGKIDDKTNGVPNIGDYANKSFDCDGSYVVASLTSVNEKGFRPFETVKEQIAQMVKMEKKYEIIKQQISEKSFNDVSVEFSAEIKTVENVNFENLSVAGLGDEPAFVGISDATDVSATSSAFKGNNSVFILQVVSKETAKTEGDFTLQQKDKIKKLSLGAFNLAFKILKERANITDNRISFY